MYLWSFKYVLENTLSNRRTNTVNFRGRNKAEATNRFHARHPSEEILKVKQLGVLMMYTADKYD